VGANRDGFLEVVLLRHSDRQPVPEINVAARSERNEAAGISGSNGVVVLRLPVGQCPLTGPPKLRRLQRGCCSSVSRFLYPSSFMSISLPFR
jgi:hypothetical protein